LIIVVTIYMKITHLKNKSIDYVRWNDTIAQSHNQLTYAFSWYLDVVSPEWEALVSEDYSYIMPLPIKSRYKIPYLVQPVLTQQLGIFSKYSITESIVKKFIKEIPYFSYELALNEQNFYSKALIFPNFILDLNSSYKGIFANYSKNTQRNVEKASKLNLTIKKINPDTYISFYFSVDKHYLSPQQPILEKLIEKGLSERALKLVGVYSDNNNNNNNNNLIAALCFLETEQRIIYMLPVSNFEGKNSFAMFFLIDNLIKQNASQQKVIDFEGSRIEGVARLYRGFGAKYHPYYILKRFRPSFLIRK
jgi:hypothetical protein